MAQFIPGHEAVEAIRINEPRFLSLLEKLIGEARGLQNNPAQGLVPRENAASDHVLALLDPYTEKNGGKLQVQRVEFVEGRGNVIVTCPGTTDHICSFVGSHLDVVPADPAGWDRDPFTLTREGDMLYGRGTTDCLGHVAMLTDFLISLAQAQVSLKTTVVVIFIANEENSTFMGVGVDQLAKEGYMDSLLRGPLYWIDSADSHPCIGTAGSLQWKLKVKGKLFHSGLPHKGINAIEMAMDAISYIQQRFFTDFLKHERETEYNFATQSTFKPTQIRSKEGALNQIPSECTVEGDIRLSPFYDIVDAKAAVERYVADINALPEMLEKPLIRGPHSKYKLPAEGGAGRCTLKWADHGDNGIACNLDTPGHRALLAATKHVIGDVQPYSIGGSLPLVRELQSKGFDVQIAGYGLSARYHADNEAASLTCYHQATQIVAKIVSLLEEEAEAHPSR